MSVGGDPFAYGVKPAAPADDPTSRCAPALGCLLTLMIGPLWAIAVTLFLAYIYGWGHR